MLSKLFIPLVLIATFVSDSYGQEKPNPSSAIQIVEGAIKYTPSVNGDRVPDYSYCGYKNSNEAIPNVAVKVVVPVITGDATESIQKAINYVSSLPMNKSGF